MNDLPLNILGFDTSSKALTVAGSNRQGLLAESNFFGLLQHSENLFPLIESILQSVKVRFEELDCFAMGLGPGSFTGLRIGFSVLKGFLIIQQKPVYGFSSLDLIAQGITLKEGRLAVIVNARRERIYTSFYNFRDGICEREKAEDEILSLGNLLKHSRGKIHFAGDALHEYGNPIRKNKPKAIFFGENFWYPRASHLISLVHSRYRTLKPLGLEALKPKYLRLSEAEEKTIGNLHTSSRSS